ncbi:hypothetical protein RF11_16309 [Thelohanellus kitauei]|uniref:Uncharacterized protein n=1 Tax=Thelohanellus kitauei TaxID=669202 RepID=A0A0C2JW06_THEKT|nr:hypothetical protein RF11_16309 [Thelohanellus kitauei]
MSSFPNYSVDQSFFTTVKSIIPSETAAETLLASSFDTTTPWLTESLENEGMNSFPLVALTSRKRAPLAENYGSLFFRYPIINFGSARLVPQLYVVSLPFYSEKSIAVGVSAVSGAPEESESRSQPLALLVNSIEVRLAISFCRNLLLYGRESIRDGL